MPQNRTNQLWNKFTQFRYFTMALYKCLVIILAQNGATPSVFCNFFLMTQKWTILSETGRSLASCPGSITWEGFQTNSA